MSRAVEIPVRAAMATSIATRSVRAGDSSRSLGPDRLVGKVALADVLPGRARAELAEASSANERELQRPPARLGDEGAGPASRRAPTARAGAMDLPRSNCPSKLDLRVSLHRVLLRPRKRAVRRLSHARRVARLE